MNILKLHLSNFRNYQDTVIEFSPGINFIYGKNGQGKTSLLEAIYLLIAGRSFRTATTTDLIGKWGPAFSLEVNFVKHGVEQKLKVNCHPEARQIIFNSTSYPSWVSILGLLCGVIFVPDDNALVKGAPQVRRHFIDIQLAQSDPLYVHHLGRYKKAMKQRNLLLRQRDIQSIYAWEAQMAQSAAYISLQRHASLMELAEKCVSLYENVGGQHRLELAYLSHVKQVGKYNIESLVRFYLHQYDKHRHREMELGSTLTGPHRDDFGISLGERSAADFASDGQQKSCIGAIRLAEWQRLKEKVGVIPLMMVDDLASGLDEERRNRYLHQLKNLGQVFVTSVEDFSMNLGDNIPIHRHHIIDGAVVARC